MLNGLSLLRPNPQEPRHANHPPFCSLSGRRVCARRLQQATDADRRLDADAEHVVHLTCDAVASCFRAQQAMSLEK